MPDKAPVVPKSDADVTPAPVEVVASIPLMMQIAPESLASLGAPPAGTAEPVKAAAAGTSQATLTPQAQPVGGSVNMTVVAPSPPGQTVAKADNLTLAPTTTAADDKVTEGQRHINRVWEYSQAAIALMITFAVIWCAVNEITSQELSNGFFLIIGFYFSRQNHQNTGGVGPKPDPSIQGR